MFPFAFTDADNTAEGVAELAVQLKHARSVIAAVEATTQLLGLVTTSGNPSPRCGGYACVNAPAELVVGWPSPQLWLCKLSCPTRRANIAVPLPLTRPLVGPDNARAQFADTPAAVESLVHVLDAHTTRGEVLAPGLAALAKLVSEHRTQALRLARVHACSKPH